MTDNLDSSTHSKESNLRERLAMVEQQQRHQKEVLLEINDTLKEVVKTQYVLANQRKEIDALKKDVEYSMKKLHESEIERATNNALIEQQNSTMNKLEHKVNDELIPYQNKLKTYLKIISFVGGLCWSVLLVYLKFFLVK